MNSRERVLKAFKLMPGMPDRVPVQFDLCRSLSDHFGKVLNIPVNYTDNLYEDVTYRISANELRLAMGSDVVITGASVSDDFRIVPEADALKLVELGVDKVFGPGTALLEIVGFLRQGGSRTRA